MKLLAITLVIVLASLAYGEKDDALLTKLYDKEHVLAADSRRVMQASVADCVWDGAICSLRRDFVKGLPGVLGSPTTESARILADAALRAAVCSNFTGKPDCLAAMSYSCDWDTVLDRCTLADLLNATMLRGRAYCPGSPLDVAMGCLALPASDPDCAAGGPNGLNCTLTDGLTLPLTLPASLSSGGGGGGGFSGLVAAVGGDRQLSTMLGSMLATMAKYGMAGMADPLSQLIGGLLQTAAGTAPSVKVCAASWLTDPSLVSSVAGLLGEAVRGDRDFLSAVLSSSSLGLAGSCNGTLPLLAAAADCQDATAGGPAACAARAPTSGCRWLSAAGVGVCSLGPEALPALTLDPSDRWVKFLNNASAICRSFNDSASCGAAVNIASDLRTAAAGAAAGGAAGTAAANSVWVLAAAAAVAVALGDAARRMHF